MQFWAARRLDDLGHKDNTMNKLTLTAFVMALALLASAPLSGQSMGFDVPTIKPFLIAHDGRLVFEKTVNGKVNKPSPGYRAWPYSGNPLASQALDPDDHERIIKIVQKAVYGGVVDVGWVTGPGFAGGFMVFVKDRPLINALQVAMWHMQFGESVTIDKLRFQFQGQDLLSGVPRLWDHASLSWLTTSAVNN